MRVALTQATGRLESLLPGLRALGVEVISAPLIATRPLLDDATRRSAAALLGLPWRCYPSRSSVEAWAALRLPFADGARLAAVGAGTAAALVRHGAAGGGTEAPLTPAPLASTAVGLAAALLAAGAAGQQVGLVQGRRARPELAEQLRRGGAKPRRAVVYEVITLPWRVTGSVDAVVLASPSAVAALPAEVGQQAQLVALGPTTAAALRERGWSCLQAREPSAAGVLAALAGLTDDSAVVSEECA